MKRFTYNDELEAAVREDPDDDDRWSVLEDWILEQDDERAQLVKLAKAGDRDGALRATWEIARAAVEAEPFSGLYAATAGCQWRAGYVDRGYFEAPASTRMEIFQKFLAMRETALMRQLRITIDAPSELPRVIELLAGAPCKQSLRRLLVAAYWKPPTQHVKFHARSIAPLQLDELHFYDRAVRIEYADPLERIRRMSIVPGAPDDLSLFGPNRFAELCHLHLDLRTLEARGWHRVDAIDGVFACLRESATIYVSEPMFAQIRERAPSGIELERR